MSLILRPASLRAVSQGVMLLFTKSSTNCSNLALVKSMFKCLGPSWVAVINGRFTFVFCELESSILAFSAASLRRCMAIGSFLRSMPSSLLNSSAKKSINFESKSSPPKCVSPLVDFTSNTPSPSSRIDTSKVPPPKSYTAMV